MEKFRKQRIACGLVVGFFVLATLAADVWAQEAKRQTAAGADTARRPWFMVSLTPQGSGRGGLHAFSVIKRLSGNPNGMVLHFSEVTAELMAEKQPEFIILSPQGTPWCRYSGERGIALQNFLWTLPVLAEEMNIPILGICGGHQALALAFGGKVGPLRAGEDDCMPYGRDRQGGVVPLTLKAPDPIFSGLQGALRILESHYDEVKVLPRGFVLLASDKYCPIQIMRHGTRPVYGIQGHPEYFSENRPDGGMLIRNFLRIADAHNRSARSRQSALPTAPQANLASLKLPTGRPQE
jgi:GMP synthase (glutamine-hydrolysing)